MSPTNSLALVFLGGTAGKSTCRRVFIDRLVARRLPRGVLFDPAIEDWDERARAREERPKNDARTFLLVYLRDPQQAGSRLSAYSVVDATLAICNDARRAAIVFDTDGVDDHDPKVLTHVEALLRAQVPIFHSLGEAEAWVLDKVGASEVVERRTALPSNSTRRTGGPSRIRTGRGG